MNTKRSYVARMILELLPFVLIAGFLFLCVFLIGHFKSYTIKSCDLPASAENNGVAETTLPATIAATEKIPFITDTRLILEHEDGIGIFDCFGELLEVYEINLAFLPTSDRQTLKEGITFDSEGEMRNFLESLDS